MLDGVQVVPIVVGINFRPSRAILVTQSVIGKPRSDRECHDHRHKHRDRDVERHGTHVGPYHPGDEKHRQKTGDDGQRRGNERRTNFGHSLKDDPTSRLLAQREMPGDILHVHNGVVHQ